MAGLRRPFASVVVAAVLATGPAYAALPNETLGAPAVRYAALSPRACEDELTARGVAYTSVATSDAPSVLAPIRLQGAMHGVTFRLFGSSPGSSPESKTEHTSPWEVVDCRLALALDDFAEQLAKHDIVEVLHYSMYRPSVRRRPKAGIGSRHVGGLAIDVASFVKQSGESLVVARDFHGRIGAKTCGPNTGPWPATDAARELRQIACDAAASDLFNVELTPNFNRAHRNHFHLEVTFGVPWFYVH